MKPKQSFILFFSLFLSTALPAQDEPQPEKKPAQNFIKVNLTALPLKNYSLQYERVIKKSISFAISFRTMPSTTLPFKNQILDIVGNDPDVKKTIENFKLTNTAITPELRFYLSKKGFGRGFYIAPFYRYAKFKTTNLMFDYQGGTGPIRTINLSGDLVSNTGGILFGAQWALGKMIVLDWSFFGPHYGGATGLFSGTTTTSLTQSEQDDLRNELENIDIPFTRKTITVNANGASMKLEGPWAGVRAAISLGLRF